MYVHSKLAEKHAVSLHRRLISDAHVRMHLPLNK
jgi:hypothetical protein